MRVGQIRWEMLTKRPRDAQSKSKEQREVFEKERHQMHAYSNREGWGGGGALTGKHRRDREMLKTEINK